MAQNSSNSTMEMGTSDQVLVVQSNKKNRKVLYIVGFIVMLLVIGAVVALVVVFAGNEGSAEDETTTDSPTTVVTPPTVPTDPTDTTAPPTPEPTPPPTEPPEDLFELEDIIEGVFAPPSFNGSWISGSEVLYRAPNGDLVRYNVDTEASSLVVGNSSLILQQSARFMQLSPDGNHVVIAHNVTPIYRHSFEARYSSIDLVSGDASDIYPTPGMNSTEALLQNFVWGPTGTSLAFVYRNNIYYQETLTSVPQAITATGEEDVVYHGIPDWVYEEEVFGSNNAMWFSSNGARLAYASFDDRAVRIMNVPHYGVPGSLQYQYTRHHDIRYPKPGTQNPTVSVTLRDLTLGGATTEYSEPTDLEEPILRVVRFVTDDSIAIMWTNRVQYSMKVDLCALGSTACTTIFEYTETDGWIDNIPLIFNNAGTSFITILPQTVNGQLYKQVVQVSQTGVPTATWTLEDRSNTAHTVLEILQWTDDDIIWYKATSITDSAQQHVFTVNSDREVTCFTCNIVREDGGQCLYNDVTLSPDATRGTVNCAGPSIPQVLIYDVNGTLVRTWDENTETAALLENRNVPEIIRLSVPVATGLPEADVHIQVPNDYEQRTNVPLLVYVYGGPDSSLVTKQWSIDWGTSLVSRWGIAVAHIDGRGSGLRGVANTFALNRQLGSYEIEDQITVTRHLQETLPWLDSNRTCIWGWSYGGYAASLALARGGEVFRCAAAVAPVVDWRYYDTIYTERYMDIPMRNPTAYNASSLLSQEVADAFRDKRYFLIHGTADDNVHYQHAMLLSRLLQRQDVYFTQMSYTDEDHGLGDVRLHLYHGLEKFLQENLL